MIPAIQSSEELLPGTLSSLATWASLPSEHGSITPSQDHGKIPGDTGSLQSWLTVGSCCFPLPSHRPPARFLTPCISDFVWVHHLCHTDLWAPGYAPLVSESYLYQPDTWESGGLTHLLSSEPTLCMWRAGPSHSCFIPSNHLVQNSNVNNLLTQRLMNLSFVTQTLLMEYLNTHLHSKSLAIGIRFCKNPPVNNMSSKNQPCKGVAENPVGGSQPLFSGRRPSCTRCVCLTPRCSPACCPIELKSCSGLFLRNSYIILLDSVSVAFFGSF